MTKDALRLAVAGTLAILLTWSASQLVMFAQLAEMNETALRILYTDQPSNFGYVVIPGRRK